MGTSSLYKGPRRTVFLPDGYGDENEQTSTQPCNDSVFGQDDSPENPDNDGNHRSEPKYLSNSGALWRSARRAVSKTVGGSDRSIRRAASSYTKALGGSKNAARQAKGAQRVTSAIYTLFSGNHTEIRENLKKVGIQLEGRTNTEIFKDVCSYLSPTPDDLEKSLINQALNKTMADIVSEDGLDEAGLNIFNPDLLNKMVGGLITNYIYDKLLNQAGQGMLNKDMSPVEVKKAEHKLKSYISTIVKHSVKKYLKNGISGRKVREMIQKLYETSYAQMEVML